MRVEIDIDVDAYVAMPQQRGWAVGSMRYQELEIRLRKEIQDFLQAQTDDHIEWYTERIEHNLHLERIPEGIVIRKVPKTARPYKVIKVEGE